MTGCYDFDGNEIPYEEWVELFFHSDRHVACSAVGDHVEVSTVFMGLDYSFGTGTPLIYETMIFGGPHDEECWRTPNREAALAAHDQAVALAREAAGVSR